MLTRVYDVRDWGSGIPLRNELLGKLSNLELHHIFPKNLLYKAGCSRPDVNSLANFTFLTKATNLEVTNRDPREYIPHYEQKHPGVVATHWIPMDPELWRIDNYREFLAERRKLLAEAANAFLDELLGGDRPDVVVADPVVGRTAQTVAGERDEDEAQIIADCRTWAAGHALADPVEDFEVADPESGEPLAILDLAWPDGVQVGRTEPVALLLNEASDVHRVAAERGFRFFTTYDAFKTYVETEILEEPGALFSVAAA